MTDPYPEARRRQRLDRSTHRRPASQGRGRSRGPSERDIKKALDDLATHDVPGEPRLRTLKILDGLHESETCTDTRDLRGFSITRGDPQHGAYRSDDHIGRYELALPLAEVDEEAHPTDECPECGGERAVYKYRAHHYIAGSESLFCETCETKLWGEDWG